MSGFVGGGDTPNPFGGQTSVFRQNMATSQPSVFGSETTSVSTSNVFGTTRMSPFVHQASSGSSENQTVFGGSSKASSETVFGQPNTQPFKIPTSGTNLQNIFGGNKFNQSSSSFGQGNQSLTNKVQFAFGNQTQSSGMESSGFGGKMKMATAFGSPAVSDSSTASRNFGMSGDGVTKTETSVFGKSGSTVFGGQPTTQTGTVFGKTSSGPVSKSQQPKYVPPSNNVFGASSSPTQTSISSIFGGVKSFGSASQSAQSSAQFTFTNTSVTTASKEKTDGESPVKSSASTKWSQRRIIRKSLDQGTSASGRRSVFSRRVSGDKKQEKDSKSDNLSEESNKVAGNTSESPSDRSKYRRMSSSAEDISSKSAIVCKGIPVRLNKGPVLRKHFSQFGSVSKVFPNVNKNSAIIHFQDHDSASRAKRKGHTLARDISPIQIFWRSLITKPSPTDRSRRAEQITTTKETSRKTKFGDGDVDDELQSMAGTSDVQGRSVRVLKRPKDSPSKKTSEPKRRSEVSPAKGDIVSIQNLTKAVAKSVTEKMQILDQRDKLIRQARAKHRSLEMAQAFIGTCKDMCPEKERYDREDKRRLSIFEYLSESESTAGQNPKADPARCVKEYSRASADQEEPLPHELRPEPVLAQTMTYLLIEIADRGDDSNWSEWYQFLWDRTRGIRKEITQQQLCTETAVGLIEKCVRFHVFCSERLCEQDMSVFDEKINNENLTKCLQTLKEFYHDLERKQAIFCTSEAEFRAYIVLMNLNEGDTLREIQQLRPEVRNAQEVKLAIKVYNALNSNNFVRFFRLVKEASFLSACIMHRYFNQVRQKALSTILKAYRDKGSKFPLQDLIRMLYFESSQEACHFCEFYGLHIQDEAVILERSSFIVPETSYPPVRSKHLIESKRQIPVGEVMNGEPFEVFRPPPPTCSFDSEGKFILTEDLKTQVLGKSYSQTTLTSAASSQPAVSYPEAVAADDQPDLPTPSLEPAEPLKVVFPNELVKIIAKDLFIEVIDEFVVNMSQSLVVAAFELGKAAEGSAMELIEETSHALIREICDDIYQQEKEKHSREEREAWIGCISEYVCEEMLENAVQQETRNLVTAEIREKLAVQKRKRTEQCIQLLSDDWIEESVHDMVREICSQVHQEDVVERLKQLDETEECIKLHRAGRHFQVWKKRYADRIKLKRAMLAFPCAPSCQSVSAQLKQLLPDRESSGVVNKSIYVNRHARVNIDSPVEMFQRNLLLTAQVSLKCLHQHLVLQKAWQPYDVVFIVGNEVGNAILSSRDEYFSKIVPRIYWKLIVSLPDCEKDSWSDELNSWISAKFHKGKVPSHPLSKYKGEVLCLYHSKLEMSNKQRLHLGVCVRTVVGNVKQEDMENIEQNRLLLGTSAIIFILPELRPSQAYWQEAHERLKLLVYGKPADPAQPLVVVIPHPANEWLSLTEVSERLDIPKYANDDLILDVHWLDISLPASYNSVDDIVPDLSERVNKGLQWLASRLPPAPPLIGQPVRQYVEDFLLEEYFTPVLQNLKARKNNRLLHQGPNILITLYNNVVEHLAEVASMSDLKKYSWPVAEFVWTHSNNDLPLAHWNTSKQLSYLYEEISLLQLPRFKFGDFDNDTWDQACDDVWAFVSSVVEQNKGRDTVSLVTRIKTLLKKVRDDFEDVCFLETGQAYCEPTYINMPWTDVIDACINYRLMCLSVCDPLVTDQELCVYYRDEDLRDYAVPASWEEAAMSSAEQDEDMLESTFHKAAYSKSMNLSMNAEPSQTGTHLASEESMDDDDDDDDDDDNVDRDRKVPKHSQRNFENSVNSTSVSQCEDVCMESEMEKSVRSECVALAQSVRSERRKTEQFSQYLQSVLNPEHTGVMTSSSTVEQMEEKDDDDDCDDDDDDDDDDDNNKYVLNETVADKMEDLVYSVMSEKKKSELFERRLKMLMHT